MDGVVVRWCGAGVGLDRVVVGWGRDGVVVGWGGGGDGVVTGWRCMGQL